MLDSVLLNTPKNTTLISSVRGWMVQKSSKNSGALTGETFVTYIIEQLVLSLYPRDTVIMDNLRCHKVEEPKEAIESADSKVISPCRLNLNTLYDEPILQYFYKKLK